MEQRRRAGAAIVRWPVALAWVCAGAALVVVGYWAVWFTHRSVIASSSRPSYLDFENAFPAADGWLTLCLLLAALALLRGWASAGYWLLAAGASGLYLFGMDVCYDVQHDVWAAGAGGAVEGAINALTLALSLLLLRVSWTALVGPAAEE
ncbi:hypothetical protein C7C46_13810 [Streptomyces tateyamensis]|uniref:Uncharacterized protein n=1 Tax=Streptomyces tateyamensis TaxID=565073 RepID=A0A2V4N950_9ACTN|nr:hypothetical protein [Streptomyces tateyamensis]PYC79753.1 hypothetical protein C7C46_13810 [Streptomyces tateyamensis]